MTWKKTDWIVVIFKTTQAALQIEKAAKAEGMDGRLIPVPRKITVGCGLAWSAPAETEAALRDLIERHGITPEGMQKLMM